MSRRRSLLWSWWELAMAKKAGNKLLMLWALRVRGQCGLPQRMTLRDPLTPPLLRAPRSQSPGTPGFPSPLPCPQAVTPIPQSTELRTRQVLSPRNVGRGWDRTAGVQGVPGHIQVQLRGSTAPCRVGIFEKSQKEHSTKESAWRQQWEGRTTEVQQE